MFFDLFNDAIKQAKNELEKTVDTALGIGGPAAPASAQQPGHDVVEKPAAPEGAVQPAKKGKKASARKPKADSGSGASAVSVARGPQPDESSITGSAMQKEPTPHTDNGCGTDLALVKAGDMCQQDQDKETILAAGTSSSSNMHAPFAVGDPAAEGLHAHHHSHHPADTEAGQPATALLQPSEAPAQPAIPSTATAQHRPPGQGDMQQAPNPVLEDPAPGPQGPSEAPPGPPQATLLGPPVTPQGPVAPSQGPPPGPEDVRSGSMGRVALPPDISSLDHDQLVGLVHRLHADMGAREAQLLRQAQLMSQNQQVMAQLQDKAEVAALKSAKVSEADLEDMRKECEQRLGAAERKVYALTKERDALKRGNEKLADYTSLIREKDGIIKQVMEEGEKLSSRVSELEALLKKTRGQAKDFEMERDQLASRLAAEEAVSEGLRRAKAKAERDLAALQESVRQELEASRQQVELALQRGRAEQAEQDERMHEATHAALTRKLRDAEARCEALGESVMELRDALERQRQAADLREEMLQQDLADLERRCQAAELRHQELTAKLPEATRPLLRQIEAMQTAAEAQSDAWAAAEHTLVSRINEAEARAATAVERERGSLERCQVLQARLAGLEAALASSRTDLTSLRSELETAEQLTRSLQQQLGEVRQAAELATQRYNLLGQQLEQAESRHAQALAAARQAAESAATSLRKEVQVLEARLAQAAPNGRSGQEGAEQPGAWPAQSHAEGMSRGGMEPPAMAAPGYRWVLQKASHSLPAAQPSDLVPDVAAGEASPAPAGTRGVPEGDGGGGGMWSSLTSASSGGPSLPLASELEGMRAALRIKAGEVSSLEAQVRALELTRDRLAEELVAAAQTSDQAMEVLHTVAALKLEVEEVRARYVAAVELLGERDEALEELRADLLDVRNMYKEQLEFMLTQLTAGVQGGRQTAELQGVQEVR